MFPLPSFTFSAKKTTQCFKKCIDIDFTFIFYFLFASTAKAILALMPVTLQVG